MEEIRIETRQRQEMVDITGPVRAVVERAGIREGLLVVYSPHTTGAVTVNENWDPDVQRDLLHFLAGAVPHRHPDFRHAEGNSDSHILTSLVGPSVTLVVSGGSVRLGQWQGIFFCEFDGPRRRSVWVQVVGT
ncbi:conserved protein of unknown function [Candidatus Hydrogenisulfobacillus filiaventi]|uniref:YjbQ family protein n=1 Tax=Candidatus Hydrogenisulfobacillus filiaventi TaxID=2707344 RepID=A0A6F8ZFK4_9FIRM|nr:secondary thiamine-phosphate synthase enzyme YjbQ [Bacillota bacterium]CAB1128242.1 conserved protein of unknown function [Candidatus Hydrogenisulfobacillus filiaventi]